MSGSTFHAFGQHLADMLGVPFDRFEAAVATSREPEKIDAALGLAPGSVVAAAQALLGVARAWHSSAKAPR
jgi:hypothetical protein